MSKLTGLQGFISNDLKAFRAPFFKDMKAFPAPEPSEKSTPHKETCFCVPSLDIFENWYISGIVGGQRPSTYSESPQLWNPYFNGIGRKGAFFSFDLPREKNFTGFLKIILEVPGFLDLTVTDPYKHTAFQALQDLNFSVSMSNQAQHTRAVNHVILDKKQEKLLALNTDGLGMIRAIKERIDIEGKKVLIIGAGGSAASIGYEFIKAGNDLFVSNRTPARAKDLVQLLAGFKNSSQLLLWGGFDQVTGFLKQADIVINTVASGCPLSIQDAELLNKDALLAETKYGGKSELRDLARSANRDYVDGKAMLFGQFIEAAAYVSSILCVSIERHEQVITGF